jgi:hypothetical protein
MQTQKVEISSLTSRTYDQTLYGRRQLEKQTIHVVDIVCRGLQYYAYPQDHDSKSTF